MGQLMEAILQLKSPLPRYVRVTTRISYHSPGLGKCILQIERPAILPTHKEAARAKAERAEALGTHGRLNTRSLRYMRVERLLGSADDVTGV